MARIVRAIGICCLALMASSAAWADDDVIRLGAVYNLSGEQAGFDGSAAHGAELAVRQANAEGGVLGRKIDLVIVDPRSNLAQATEQTRALFTNHPSTSAVLGLSDTDMVLASAPVAADHKVVFVTSGATSPKLPGQVPDYLYLACFGDNVQAAAAAEYAYKDLGARNAAIIYNASTSYTTLLQEYFRTRFEELGGTVDAVASYKSIDGQGDAIAALEEADVVFLSAQDPQEAAGAIGKLRAAGFDAPVLGGDGFDGADEWAKHPGLGQIYFTTHAYLAADNPDPVVRAFEEAYREAFGGGPPTSFAALGYDAVGVLLAAIEAGGSADPGDVLASLQGLEDYHGVTGTISYEGGSRIPKKSVTLLEVRDGKQVFVKQVLPESVPAP